MAIVLFLAAVIGGALNAVAGGGSFLTLPALILTGVSPVVANATSTLALWPASLSSTLAYRRSLGASSWRWMLTLGVVSIAGGLLGARLLVRTSDSSFLRLLPWLMLVAALAFTFSHKLRPVPAGPNAGAHRFERGASWHPAMALVVVAQFFIALYGGYFGGGMGIMMLATMALAGMTNIHEMNGLKAILGATINAMALGTFILSHTIDWRYGLLMAVSASLGAYLTATVAQKIEPRYVRRLVIVIGWGMTAYFFIR